MIEIKLKRFLKGQLMKKFLNFSIALLVGGGGHFDCYFYPKKPLPRDLVFDYLNFKFPEPIELTKNIQDFIEN